jgi:hypothetical protein
MAHAVDCESLDHRQQVVPLVALVGPVLGVLDDLVRGLEAFPNPVRDEIAEVVKRVRHL